MVMSCTITASAFTFVLRLHFLTLLLLLQLLYFTLNWVQAALQMFLQSSKWGHPPPLLFLLSFLLHFLNHLTVLAVLGVCWDRTPGYPSTDKLVKICWYIAMKITKQSLKIPRQIHSPLLLNPQKCVRISWPSSCLFLLVSVSCICPSPISQNPLIRLLGRPTHIKITHLLLNVY